MLHSDEPIGNAEPTQRMRTISLHPFMKGLRLGNGGGQLLGVGGIEEEEGPVDSNACEPAPGAALCFQHVQPALRQSWLMMQCGVKCIHKTQEDLWLASGPPWPVSVWPQTARQSSQPYRRTDNHLKCTPL